MRFHPVLVVTVLLYAVSFVLPAGAFGLGSVSGGVRPGWVAFVGVPVLAAMGVAEPGGEPWLALLGVYYLVAWTANFAVLLPLARRVSLEKRRVAARVFACFAWSYLACYLALPESIFDKLGVGYYAWAVAVTLVLPCLRLEARAGDQRD